MLPKKGKKVKWGIHINKKKVSIVFWALFCLWFVAFLLYSNIKIFGKRAEMGKELQKLDNTAENLTKESDLLKFKLGETYSEEYLERVAREDLGMQKAGETVVVIKKSGAEEGAEKEQGILQNITNWFNSLFRPE
ncbi:MAG: septum formation initiator family protein [Candidatus Pacebacteria bacterium]|nr:septum formation initiator family protein [Candidatus Paceibacterota bacterium]